MMMVYVPHIYPWAVALAFLFLGLHGESEMVNKSLEKRAIA